MAGKPPHEATGHRNEAAVERAAAITFAPFRLDLPGGRLFRDDQVIALRPKTWAVLLHLAERPGVLVTKDELLDAVWPEVAVTPDTLNKSIGELRVALGDESRAPRFIETVHRRGFRFIAQESSARDRKGVTTESVQPGARSATSGVFVGREDELQRLATCFARAQAGERQIVFVTGPAGIGKTALVEAFLDSPAVRGAAAPVWIGRGGCIDSHGPREAYLPVLEALERLARQPHAERLLELLHHTAPMWLAQMPWLVDEADVVRLRQSLQGVGAERMLRELTLLVEALTTDVTLVLVLEDLHWSDPSTIDLLSELGRRRDPARLLLIVTYRPAEVVVSEHVLADAVRTLRGHRQCVDLPLHELTEDGVRSYLEARFPGGDFPQPLAPLIHAHTSGDPLFVVAIVRHMLSRGWILDTAPGWRLSAPLETLDLGAPDDVRRMIEAEFYRLSPSERSLLEVASAAGNEMSPALAAVALGCEIGDAERICEFLARGLRFVRTAGRLEQPDGSLVRRYAFVHELNRQVVYEEIPEGRCARLHQSIGEALEEAYGARVPEISAQLAVHFERGRDPDRAQRYLMAAGARARQRFANREAIGYFQSALALLPLLPRRDERPRRELEGRLALGPVLSDIHGFGAERVRENYERAAELCTAANAAQRFDVLYALWYLHAIRSERDETIAVAAELDDVAQRLGSSERRALAASVMVRTAVYDGRFADASRFMERRLARRRQRESTPVSVASGPDPVLVAISHHAIALWFLGHPARAQKNAGEAVARARECGHFFTLCAVLAQAAIVELLCRDVTAGGQLAEEAMALSSEHGFAFWKAFSSILNGWASVQRSRASEGSVEIERAIDAMQATGTRFFSGYAYAFLADGRLQSGELGDGLAAADAGLAVAQTTLDRGFEPELWRLKGLLLLASAQAGKPRQRGAKSAAAADSRWQEAEGCLLRALEMSRASQAKSLELRAATSLARAWQTRGRAGEAHSLLSGVCAWFDTRSRARDLVDARALLGELATA